MKAYNWLKNRGSNSKAADKVSVPKHPLAKYHMYACLLHLGQAVATGVLAGVLDERYDKDVKFKRDVLFSVPVAALIPGFFGISAAGHAYSWLKANLYRRMEKMRCWQRWAEYALSASLMSLSIALLCTVDQVVTLGCIIAFTGLTMQYGYKVEKQIAKIPRYIKYMEQDAIDDKRPSEQFWIAVVLQMFVWGITLAYYISEVGSVPWFVHAIVGVLITCYTAYPVAMIIYQRRMVDSRLAGSHNLVVTEDTEEMKQAWASQGKQGTKHTRAIATYEWVEKVYLSLSLLAKTSLGWLVFWGAIKAQ